MDRDLVEAAERNYLDAWRTLVDAVHGGVVRDDGDVLFTAVPTPVAYFNSAFVRPPASPAACIDRAKSFFSARNSPFTLRFRASDEGARACEATGLAPAGTSPLMVAAVADIAPPSNTDVRPVDAASWDAHLATIAAGFGMPVDVLRALIGPDLLDIGHYAGFLAYVDDEAASTAALIVTDDIAGVYNVATPVDFRRRGLGEAATRAAVSEGARRGCTVTTLQASDMGYPIYERMGYRTVARWLSFTG